MATISPADKLRVMALLDQELRAASKNPLSPTEQAELSEQMRGEAEEHHKATGDARDLTTPDMLEDLDREAEEHFAAKAAARRLPATTGDQEVVLSMRRPGALSMET